MLPIVNLSSNLNQNRPKLVKNYSGTIKVSSKWTKSKSSCRVDQKKVCVIDVWSLSLFVDLSLTRRESASRAGPNHAFKSQTRDNLKMKRILLSRPKFILLYMDTTFDDFFYSFKNKKNRLKPKNCQNHYVNILFESVSIFISVVWAGKKRNNCFS